MKNVTCAEKVCRTFGLALTLSLLGLAATADATLITLNTADDATQAGLPVSAKASFNITNGHIKLVLENLIVDPVSVAQNISGISFTLSSGQAAGTLTSSQGVDRDIESGGTYTDGSSVSTGWLLSTVNNGFQLTMLGTPEAPAHTIVGAPALSGIYAKANKSLAGNDPHNPFLDQTATFNLDVPGVTPSSTIASIIFTFNTTPGYDTPIVPEPATIMLLAMGGLGFLCEKKRTRLGSRLSTLLAFV